MEEAKSELEWQKKNVSTCTVHGFSQGMFKLFPARGTVRTLMYGNRAYSMKHYEHSAYYLNSYLSHFMNPTGEGRSRFNKHLT